MEYTLFVNHPMLKQSFENHSAQLLGFLRDRLHNDFVTVKAMLNPDKEIVKPMTPREFLEKAVRVNSRLAGFLKEIDIEL